MRINSYEDFRSLFSEDNVVRVVYAAHRMAYVYFNGAHVMSGNHWDFYPGCHGGWFYDLAKKWGEFRTCDQLARALANAACEDGMAEGTYRSVRVEETEEVISR